MIAGLLLNALTHTAVLAIVMSGIFVIFQLPLIIDLGPVIEAVWDCEQAEARRLARARS